MSHAGAVLLTETARVTGVAAGLSQALERWRLPHVEAMLDDQFRALLGRSDDRAERILDYPPGHFARARERARAKLKE